MASTSFTDIHPHIIQSHILPQLDGPSLSAATTASSYLQTLSADQNLWYDICNSTWPSIAHPHVENVISTFRDSHRSFFEDSFPVLATEDSHQGIRQTGHFDHSSHPLPSELISAIDIRYQNNIVYSKLIFTDTTSKFLSSKLWIEVNNRSRCSSQPVPVISRSIDLKVDEHEGADDATVSHLKESLTLSWIVIEPMRKRAANLSSIRPVLARKDWESNEAVMRFDNILPGCDPNDMIQFRIEVKLGVGKGGVGLHVTEVILHGQDLVCGSLSGKEFLVIIERAISEENNVRRKVMVMGGDDMQRRYEEFKKARREKMEWLQKQQRKRDVVTKVNDVIMLVYLVMACILCIKICIH